MVTPLKLLIPFLILLTIGATPKAEPHNAYDLSCTGSLVSIVDAPQYTRIREMKLNGTTLTIEIEYGIRSYALKQRPATLADAPGMGYALDAEPVVMVRSLSHSTQAVVGLTFYALHNGKHRIAIGIVDRPGALTQANSFCFSTPGHFSGTGNLYL